MSPVVTSAMLRRPFNLFQFSCSCLKNVLVASGGSSGIAAVRGGRGKVLRRSGDGA